MQQRTFTKASVKLKRLQSNACGSDRLVSYDPHELLTWKCFFYTHGTVLMDRTIWFRVLKLLLIAGCLCVVMYFIVEHPEDLNTDRFLRIVDFFKVFVAFLLGLYLNNCLSRWWSTVEALTDFLYIVKKLSWTLTTCSVHEEKRFTINRYCIASCHLLAHELCTFWDAPEETAVNDEKWIKLKLMLIRDGLLFPDEIMHLETHVYASHRSAAVWTWIGTVVCKSKDDVKNDPMMSWIAQECGDAVEEIKRINTYITVQIPFSYAHVLATLVHLNNLLLSMVCGIVVGGAVSNTAHHVKYMHEHKVWFSVGPDGLNHMSICYENMQNMFVQVLCLVAEPVIYMAFLHIASTLCHPFTDDVYGMPLQLYIEDLTIQLDEMNTTLLFPHDVTPPVSARGEGPHHGHHHGEGSHHGHHPKSPHGEGHRKKMKHASTTGSIPAEPKKEQMAEP